MATEINDVIDALKIILDTALGVNINDSYDYRTMPDKLYRTYTISYQGGMPTSLVTAGDSTHMNFVIVLGAKHDKTEASMRDADRDLNTLETAILSAIETSKNALWFKIVMVYPSFRPRAFIEMPETRIAEIPIRILLR